MVGETIQQQDEYDVNALYEDCRVGKVVRVGNLVHVVRHARIVGFLVDVVT